MIFWPGLVFMYLVWILLVVFSTKIVSWHAKMYRDHYPNEQALKLLDQAQEFNPLSKLIIGKMSNYATRGPEHPEDFPRMIWFARSMGLIPMIGCTIALILTLLKR